MPSTKDATTKLAPTRRAMLQAFLDAIDAFHVAQEKVVNGIDPQTGAALEDAAAALDAATARLTQALHAAIDAGWIKASADALSTMWGKAEAPVQAARVLESEVARQKAFASRFALDIARGETEEKRKIPEPTRAAMYADAAEAGYQTAAALGAPDGALIWWRLGEVSRHCVVNPDARVWTRRGLLPISEVVVGDEVMTHRGRFMPVTETHAVPVEETSTNLGITMETAGARLTLTADHVLLTASGWRSTGKVDFSGANKPLRVTNEDLRGVWPGVQVPGPYEVPGVPADVRVREAEIAQVCGLHGLRPWPEGGTQPSATCGPVVSGGTRGADEGDWSEAPWDEDQSSGSERQKAPRRGNENLQSSRSDVGGLQATGEGRTVCGPGAPTGRAPSRDLPLPMAVGAGERSDSERDGDSPHQRGPGGRSPGEPPDDDRPGAQEAPPADGGRLGPGRGLPVRHVRDGVSPKQGEGCLEVGEAVLRSALPGPVLCGTIQGAEGSDALRGVREGRGRRTGARETAPRMLSRLPGRVEDGEGAPCDHEVRGVRDGVHPQPGSGGRSAHVLEEVHGPPVPVAPELEDHAGLRGVRSAVQAAAVPAADDVLEGVRGGPKGEDPIRHVAAAIAPGALVYDLTVEHDHSFVAEWFILANCWECPVISASSPYTRETLPTTPRAGLTPCRSRCACFLDLKPAEGVKLPTPEDRERNRRFEDRVLNPPPVPPGMRLPTPEERGVLRDLEIQRNFARRKQADAEAAGRKGEARLWQQRSRELTKNIREFAEENGVHHVPTFSVGDVINGRDIGQRDIDRLTHFRGIDGVTVSRAQVAAIKEATAAAKADVLKVLSGYPKMDAVSREEWRRLLKANGAPESAFGGELTRLAREGCDHEHEHEHEWRMTVRARPALGLVAAVEAKVPEVTVEVLPSPADWQVVNLVGETVRETLENHVAAYALLGATGRRTGVEPYRVEMGPLDDWDLVAVGGTWVQGDAAEVRRFCEALRATAPSGFALATWQAMG